MTTIEELTLIVKGMKMIDSVETISNWWLERVLDAITDLLIVPLKIELKVDSGW